MAWSLIVNEDSRYHTLLRTLSAALSSVLRNKCFGAGEARLLLSVHFTCLLARRGKVRARQRNRQKERVKEIDDEDEDEDDRDCALAFWAGPFSH